MPSTGTAHPQELRCRRRGGAPRPIAFGRVGATSERACVAPLRCAQDAHRRGLARVAERHVRRAIGLAGWTRAAAATPRSSGRSTRARTPTAAGSRPVKRRSTSVRYASTSSSASRSTSTRTPLSSTVPSASYERARAEVAVLVGAMLRRKCFTP